MLLFLAFTNRYFLPIFLYYCGAYFFTLLTFIFFFTSAYLLLLTICIDLNFTYQVLRTTLFFSFWTITNLNFLSFVVKLQFAYLDFIITRIIWAYASFLLLLSIDKADLLFTRTLSLFYFWATTYFLFLSLYDFYRTDTF